MVKEKFPYTGEDIKYLRKHILGMTLQEFSKMLGVKPTTVNNWEVGRNYPKVGTWPVLLQLFSDNELYCPYIGGFVTYVSKGHGIRFSCSSGTTYCLSGEEKLKLLLEDNVMKEEILFGENGITDKVIEDLTNDVLNDPDYKDSIMKLGAKNLACMMIVDSVGIDGFCIESTAVTGHGKAFTIEVGRATDEQ